MYLGQKFNYPADEWTFKICNFLQPISLLSPAWFRFFCSIQPQDQESQLSTFKKKYQFSFLLHTPERHFFSKVTFYLYQLSNNVSSGLKKVIFSTLKPKKCINFFLLLGRILSVVVVVVVEWPHLLMLATPSSSSPPRTPRSPSPAAPRLRPGSCVSGPHRAARLGMCGNAQYFYSSVPTTVLCMYSVVGILDTK